MSKDHDSAEPDEVSDEELAQALAEEAAATEALKRRIREVENDLRLADLALAAGIRPTRVVEQALKEARAWLAEARAFLANEDVN